jgi:hypothetical protein
MAAINPKQAVANCTPAVRWGRRDKKSDALDVAVPTNPTKMG